MLSYTIVVHMIGNTFFLSLTRFSRSVCSHWVERYESAYTSLYCAANRLCINALLGFIPSAVTALLFCTCFLNSLCCHHTPKPIDFVSFDRNSLKSLILHHRLKFSDSIGAKMSAVKTPQEKVTNLAS